MKQCVIIIGYSLVQGSMLYALLIYKKKLTDEKKYAVFAALRKKNFRESSSFMKKSDWSCSIEKKINQANPKLSLTE